MFFENWEESPGSKGTEYWRRWESGSGHRSGYPGWSLTFGGGLWQCSSVAAGNRIWRNNHFSITWNQKEKTRQFSWCFKTKPLHLPLPSFAKWFSQIPAFFADFEAGFDPKLHGSKNFLLSLRWLTFCFMAEHCQTNRRTIVSNDTQNYITKHAPSMCIKWDVIFNQNLIEF